MRNWIELDWIKNRSNRTKKNKKDDIFIIVLCKLWTLFLCHKWCLRFLINLITAKIRSEISVLFLFWVNVMKVRMCVCVWYTLIFSIYNDNIFVCILSDSYEQCRATADWLLSRTQVCPAVAIVCGSGLGGLAEILKDPQMFNYSDVPNFPQSTGVLAVVGKIFVSMYAWGL